MVSDKTIVALIIIAVVLSAVSVILTITHMSLGNVPEIVVSSGEAVNQGQFGIYVISNPLAGPVNVTK